jgi:phosphogluconate dehydratase
MAFVIAELIGAGLAHPDIATIAGPFTDWTKVPVLDGETIGLAEGPTVTQDASVLAPVCAPFRAEGGMRLLVGNLGRAIIKTSAIPDDRHSITAPVRIFHDQDAVIAAFKAGELDCDVVVAVRFQGPRANGMPELHKLTPTLGLLQDRGHRVALITDGRMSGASGKVPAAIHMIPEAHAGGPLSRLRDGDIVTVCAETGVISADADLAGRSPIPPPPSPDGLGRELFGLMRHASPDAEAGACSLLV